MYNNNTILPPPPPATPIRLFLSFSLSLSPSLCVSCNMLAPTRSSDVADNSDNSNWKRPLDTQANAMARADSIVVSLAQWGNTCCACSLALAHTLSSLTRALSWAVLCSFSVLLLSAFCCCVVVAAYFFLAQVSPAPGRCRSRCRRWLRCPPYTHTYTQTLANIASLSSHKKYSLCFSWAWQHVTNCQQQQQKNLLINKKIEQINQ